MITFAGILRGMADDHPDERKGKILVVLRDSPRFPIDLWQRFKRTATARNEPWIDALRRALEHYIRQE